MYHNEHQIMLRVYRRFCSLVVGGQIPIDLRAPTLVGTVQDDPFDCLIEQKLTNAFPDLEVHSSGKLTTPDIVIRDHRTGVIAGIEVKKLIQKKSGADARGLTLDYNSCLPCGTALIKVGSATVDIPCYYLFALLSNDSTSIVTFILMHGDFLNYDFNLHKQAKVANESEYGHGPYGEGSVRHRAMYTYPNPLNHKLECFHEKKVLVTKKHEAENLGLVGNTTHEINRVDLQENCFVYSVVDECAYPAGTAGPVVIDDIFAACKARKKKPRAGGAMPALEE